MITVYKHESKISSIWLIYLFLMGASFFLKNVALPAKREQRVMSVCPDGSQQCEKCFLTQTWAAVQKEFIFSFQNICSFSVPGLCCVGSVYIGTVVQNKYDGRNNEKKNTWASALLTL